MYIKITQEPLGNSENRWLEDISNEHHHSLKCISSSQIKFIASGHSMHSFHEKYIARNMPPIMSDEFRIGTIAHLAVLEPEKFEKSIVISDLDQRTIEYKEFRASLCGSNNENQSQFESKIAALEEELKVSDTKEQSKVIKEKIKKLKQEAKVVPFEITFTKNGGFLNSKNEEMFIVKSEEMKMYKTFQRRFEVHKRLSVMTSSCAIEQSGVALDPTTGLWMSIRGDARGSDFFLDPKTIASELSVDSIQLYCSKYQLALQEAHYLETANLIDHDRYKNFYFVMMSKSPPYEIAFVRLDSEAKEYGKLRRREILNKIADCEMKQKWPSIDFNENQHGLVIKLPPWSYKYG